MDTVCCLLHAFKKLIFYFNVKTTAKMFKRLLFNLQLALQLHVQLCAYQSQTVC